MSEAAATEQQQGNKPDFWDERVRDSLSGEMLTLRHWKCRTCNQYIMNDRVGHPECVKQRREEEAMAQEEIRQRICKEKYGEVLTREEEQRRDWPDSRLWGRMSYNEQLRMEAAEREQERRKVIQDRQRRKERLPELERELRLLKIRIEKDAEDEAREAAEADAELAKIKQEEEAARQAEEQRKQEAEEKRRDEIDRVLRRGKYQ